MLLTFMVILFIIILKGLLTSSLSSNEERGRVKGHKEDVGR
jgi:hypothetical protein